MMKTVKIVLVIMVGLFFTFFTNTNAQDTSGSSAPSESEVKEAAIDAINNAAPLPEGSAINTIHVKAGTSGHEMFAMNEMKTIPHYVYWDVPGEVFGYFLVGYTKIEFDENVCEPIGVTSGGLFSTSISARGPGYVVVSLWYWFFDGNPISDPELLAFNITWRGLQAGTTGFDYTVTDSSGNYRGYFLTGTVHNMQRVTAVVEFSSQPPAAPTNLTAVPIPWDGITDFPKDKVNLSWTDNSSDEEKFILERSDNGINFYNLIPTSNSPYIWQYPPILADTTSYEDFHFLNGPFRLGGEFESTVKPGAIYYYRIKAVNASMESAYSNVCTAVFPLTTPKLFAKTISQSQVDIEWNSIASDLLDGVAIERKNGYNGTYSEIVVVPPGTFSYSDNSPEPATIYYYRISSYNTYTNSNYSNEAIASTFPYVPTVDNLINSLTHYYQDGAIKNKGIYYSLLAKLKGGIGQLNAFCNELKAQDNKGVSHNAVVDLLAQATNIIEYSSLPNLPDQLTASNITPYGFATTWRDNSDNEIGFIVERKGGYNPTTGEKYLDYAPVATLGPNLTSYQDYINDFLGTTYYYRVCAYNNAGKTYSNEFAINAPLPPPPAPYGLSVQSVSPSQIDIATLTNDITSIYNKYSDTGLFPSTTYYYRIKSYNQSGEGEYSESSNEYDATFVFPSFELPQTVNLVLSQFSDWWGTNMVKIYLPNGDILTTGLGGNLVASLNETADPEIADLRVQNLDMTGTPLIIHGTDTGTLYFSLDPQHSSTGTFNRRTHQIDFTARLFLNCAWLENMGITVLLLEIPLRGMLKDSSGYDQPLINGDAELYGEGTIPQMPFLGGSKFTLLSGCSPAPKDNRNWEKEIEVEVKMPDGRKRKIRIKIKRSGDGLDVTFPPTPDQPDNKFPLRNMNKVDLPTRTIKFFQTELNPPKQIADANDPLWLLGKLIVINVVPKENDKCTGYESIQFRKTTLKVNGVVVGKPGWTVDSPTKAGPKALPQNPGDIPKDANPWFNPKQKTGTPPNDRGGALHDGPGIPFPQPRLSPPGKWEWKFEFYTWVINRDPFEIIGQWKWSFTVKFTVNDDGTVDPDSTSVEYEGPQFTAGPPQRTGYPNEPGDIYYDSLSGRYPRYDQNGKQLW